MTSSYRGMGGRGHENVKGQPDRQVWTNAEQVLGTGVWAKANPASAGLLHWVGSADLGRGVESVGPERMGSVSDGTSNTLAIGEYTNLGDIRVITKNYKTSSGSIWAGTMWANGYGWYAVGAAPQQPGAGARGLIANYERCIQLGQSNLCSAAFGSAHSGNVINFVRADGSVTSISTNIDILTYGNLATIHGGEVVADY